MFDTSRAKWHPIAGVDELVSRHVYHAELLGREYAVWRADDGHVNVWENRCLHRGVRLSIGVNDGSELKCQYHGWRYANRTAGCTYIPAHPADAPARTVTNRTYVARERYGLIWTAEEAAGDPPELTALEGHPLLALRALPVSAPADIVAAALEAYRFDPAGTETGMGVEVRCTGSTGFAVTLEAKSGDDPATLALLVQPVAAARSIVRGILSARPQADSYPILRYHNSLLSRMRELIERDFSRAEARPPLAARIEPVPAELAAMPELSGPGGSGLIRVQVARKWPVSRSAMALELRPLAGNLPTVQPGGHIDVRLPNGLTRQYSVTNGPGDTASYVIGVKLEAGSRGGSRAIHESVREGDVLAVSAPRHNFPLRRDAARTVLVAGGIGITPLLAMARTLGKERLPFALHHFASHRDEQAFADETFALGDPVTAHLGLTPAETRARLETIVTAHVPATHLYVCGPGPMIAVVREIAAAAGWPEGAVHFEHFRNDTDMDDSSAFEVSLSRSCLTLPVPAGRSILEIVRDAGVDVPSSCGQGACGTCMVSVIEGEPAHQDVYLNGEERRRGDRMLICVSRAKSARLVLDL